MTTDFMGTLPGWITAASTTTGVVTIIVSYWRRGVSLRGLDNEDRADTRDHIAEEMKALRENVAGLRTELHDCEEQCRQQVKDLQEELLGEKRQRVAEQLSLINIILDSVDAPDLQKLRASLESIQHGMKPLG